jgi:hypothetical protein
LTVVGLSSSTLYYFRVASFNSASEPNFTNLGSTITAAVACTSPFFSTPFLFTDSTLTAGVSVVRVVHVTDLRTAVNELLSDANLPQPYAWTNAALTPSVSVIEAADIIDLQTAIDSVYSACHIVPPGFAPPTPASSTIRVEDVEALRSAVQSAP